MPSVFHYTDSAGLLGILSSGSLFATDYRYLNDVTEAGVIRDLIMPVFEAEIAEITPKLIEKKWLKKRVLRRTWRERSPAPGREAVYLGSAGDQ